MAFRCLRRRPCSHRLPDAVAVRVLADHGPAVLPGHRLEVHDAAVGAFVLEVQEPVVTGGIPHPGSLVRPVDGPGRPCHDDALLPRTLDPLRPEHRLPARRHAPGGSEEIVPALMFVELGPFDRRLRKVTVENGPGRPQEAGSVRIHRRQVEHALQACPGSGDAVREPRPAVLVPKRARVDESLLPHHPDGRFPRPFRILRPDHENAAVGIAHKDVEPASVVADRRCPDRIPVLHACVEIILRRLPIGPRIIRQRIIDQLPVHQVRGAKNRQPRETVERRSRHIEHPARLADIRVGIVRMDYGIGIAKRLSAYRRGYQHHEGAH